MGSNLTFIEWGVRFLSLRVGNELCGRKERALAHFSAGVPTKLVPLILVKLTNVMALSC